MSIWLDNHLSPALASWIAAEFGESCVQVRELGLERADDREIFAAARTAANVLITKDRDFAELSRGLVHRRASFFCYPETLVPSMCNVSCGSNLPRRCA